MMLHDKQFYTFRMLPGFTVQSLEYVFSRWWKLQQKFPAAICISNQALWQLTVCHQVFLRQLYNSLFFFNSSSASPLVNVFWRSSYEIHVRCYDMVP